MYILGTKIDFLSQREVIEQIVFAIQKHRKLPFFIVTANGEFVLRAQKDPQFSQALKKANLILPDGVGLLAARDFISSLPLLLGEGKGEVFTKLNLASKIFLKTLKGGYNDQIVTGVDILRYFLKIPKKPKIFLLGGYNGVSQILAEQYKTDYYQGPNDINKITQKEQDEIFIKLNTLKPDILFVAFGHFAQEKWIGQNLENLSCKVVLGVGSSFDELARIRLWRQPVPKVFQKMGLKWFWRLLRNPKHIIRVWQAVFVFPWKVYKDSFK